MTAVQWSGLALTAFALLLLAPSAWVQLRLRSSLGDSDG